MISSRCAITGSAPSAPTSSSVMDRSLAIGCSASVASSTILVKSSCSLGEICSENSIRDSDRRSAIRRLIRSDSPAMISRKRGHEPVSSLAGPRMVSIKPDSAVSGVRNSWLALARKSDRARAARCTGVRSSSTTSVCSAPVGRETCARQVSSGPLSTSTETDSSPSPRPIRSIADRSAGERITVLARGLTRPSSRRIRSAASLNATIRLSPSTSKAGSGSARSSCTESSRRVTVAGACVRAVLRTGRKAADPTK